MAAKNGYYYELNCLEWLDSNIAYEKASIRIAWQSIRCLFFVSLNNDEELTHTKSELDRTPRN